MKVNVKGFGMIEFPDSMTESEVRDVLRQFEPKKDDTTERLLKSIESLLKTQKQQVIEKPVPFAVEKQVIVKQPDIKTIEIPSQQEPVSWYFEIERDENDMISGIIAEPANGG